MNKYDFLNHRLEQDKKTVSGLESNDPMTSLLHVQFNTTELCNRTCVFCPRVNPEVYPNRNLNLEIETVTKICNDLKDINYKGVISLCGFGEPFLHKKMLDIIKTVRTILVDNVINMNTNGDQLTTDVIRKVYDNGLSVMYVNLYDGPHQIEKFNTLFNEFPEQKYILREHWPNIDETYNLILNNRSGTVTNQIMKMVTEPIRASCYFPFNHAMIDYNGDLLLCPQDWSRSYVVGSLITHTIKELWLGERMKNIRTKLINNDRSSSPCNTCDVHGRLSGEYSFNLLSNYYVQNS